MAVKGSLLKTTSALVPMFGLVGTVSAQEASNDVAIEEITVTAQRRAESLQKFRSRFRPLASRPSTRRVFRAWRTWPRARRAL